VRRAEDCQALVNSLLVRGLVLEALVRPSPIYKAEVSRTVKQNKKASVVKLRRLVSAGGR
jgi:hypothetical protein